ncbi:MAG: transcription-repair coupling factor [Planctomycetia bacterium]|nr:transcription-repair coupling factor [Planctomycetia bacterium]
MKTSTAPCSTPPAALGSLQDLPRLLQAADGFAGVVAALQAGRSATIDGAWGSSAALACAALASHAPRTLLIALAHPRDLDGWGEDLASFAGTRPVVLPGWDQWPPPQPADFSEDGIAPVLDDVSGQRLRILQQLASEAPPALVLTTFQALLQPAPAREQLARQQRVVKTGEALEPDELAGWLVEHGFQRADAVHFPGQFTRRGGILDLFSPDADAPHRLEFFGDELESIRQFSPQTQRSLGNLPQLELLGLTRPTADSSGHICDYLGENAWTVLVEPDELREQGKHFLERVSDGKGLFSIEGALQQLLRFPSTILTALPSPSLEAVCHLRVESVERFSGDIAKLRGEIEGIAGGSRVVIACHNEAEAKRLGEVLNLVVSEHGTAAAIQLLVGHVRAGFRLVEAGVVVLSDNQLFRREDVRQVQPRRRLESRAIDSFLDLAEGDLVVHISHGIGRFRGMQMLEKNGQQEEHLTLEFRDGILLYVPASKIDLVQKYVGGSKTEPELSKLGGTRWQRTKEKVQAATLDLAVEMIDLQALREAQPGIAYPPDSDWQREFEGAFPYRETPDQLTSLAEIKRDLERPRPMDRLVCGDVGYGKTELAIRAAFKTMDNGRQVAVLVPTTVLAEQHFRTFSQRLAEYPFVVDCLSRFRTAGEQKRIVGRLAQGGVDLIIGTHRLVSADVKFKDLGLVIIDEEQRFGVEHKEKLKRLRQTVDVLTLTATPIPRTLHLSLLGIRDISNLETPPPDRLAIETRIARFDPTLIRHAVMRELNREGQVYFVHNRVQNIEAIRDKLLSIVPEARIVIGHGQMSADELEDAMVRFVRREADILLATTIIESGLDIPNANTIFINQADQYGLADMHQLRGRVGRYKHRAYAYLLLDSDRQITPVATRRLKAIEEFTELGAGFKIALRDLEIRGAGNILGTQQSGHIAAVGYELYCQLLENAVRQMKNQPLRTPLEVSVDLPWPAFLPRDYVEGQRQRMEVYRRLARVRKLDRLEDFRRELRDRFGKVPEPADWMLRLAELRLLAARWQIAQVRLESQGSAPIEAPPVERKPVPGKRAARPRPEAAPSVPVVDVVLHYRNPRKIARLAERSQGRLRVVDAKTAYFRLHVNERTPPALYAALKDLLRLPERPV